MKKKYFEKILLCLLFSIFVWGAHAQYCLPSISLGCNSGDSIEDFIIYEDDSIIFEHLNTGCSSNAYGDFTDDDDLFIYLEAETDYEIEVTHGTSSQYVRIWIDFDGNEDFEDAGELVVDSKNPGGTANPSEGTISIPDVKGVVTTRMRVRTTYADSNAGSCQSVSYGETHDYTVVIVGENEDCFSPDNLEVSVLSSSEVEVTWDDSADVTEGYVWHLMTQGGHPDDDTPLQSGSLSVGDESVEIDSLAENVFYDFYIQGECEGDELTVWRKTEVFVPGQGVDCSNPFTVDAFPYSDTQDTSGFLNLLSGGPGVDCGTDSAYLDGNAVVYQVEVDEDYILHIELDGISKSYSAISVYDSCDDIGMACSVKGSYAKDSVDAHGFEIMAEEGSVYYIVISSADPTGSFEYTLNIDAMGCDDVVAPAGYDEPYFIQGDVVSSIKIEGSQFNEAFVWYSDAALNTEITDPDNELIVDGVSYYVTQTVLGCEGDALMVTPQEFDCDVLQPEVEVDELLFCVPGGYAVLKAEPSPAGDEVYWYDSKSALKPILKGVNRLDVGMIKETTSFWVSEVAVSVDAPDPSQPLEDYCTPSSGSSGCSLSDTIDDFIFWDENESVLISHLGTGCAPNAYGDYTSDPDLSADIVAGEIYHFEATHGTSLQYVRIWIDLDGNGSFDDEGELVYESNVAGGTATPTTGAFVVPESALSVNSVMRVRSTYSTGGADSCTQSSAYGEVHDYKVSITGKSILCESDRKEIVVKVTDEIPAAPEVKSSYSFCGDAAYTLADIEVEGQSIQWYSALGVELELDTLLEDGEVYYVADKAGACVSDLAAVSVSISDFSDIPIGEEEQDFEEGDMLASLDVEGINLKWYADADKEESLPINTLLEDNAIYYVTQTEVGFCESEVLAIQVNLVLGVEDFTFKHLQVAPNPVRGELLVANTVDLDKLEVYNLLGQKVEVPFLYHNSTEVKMNFESLPASIYLLKITSNGVMKTFQVIKK